MEPSSPIAPDAVDFLLDTATGDLALVSGEVVPATGLTAIAQACRVRLSLWKREWFWNPAEGLPMIDGVLSRGVPLDDIKAVFNRALLLVPGVTRVTSLRVTRNNAPRTLLVEFEADTNNGVLRSSDFGAFLVAM